MFTTAAISKAIIGILLGIIQGISEWLPVSSKTQILLASTLLLRLNFSQAYALGLFLEGGTFLAALIYFRKEVWKTLLAIVGKGGEEGKLLLKFIIIVTIVTAIIAVPIYKFISSINGPVIGIPMIILGILLIIDGVLIKLSKSNKAHKELKNLSIVDMVLIGISQGIAALPGVSRSGTTVSAMLFLKIRARRGISPIVLRLPAFIPRSVPGNCDIFQSTTYSGICGLSTSGYGYRCYSFHNRKPCADKQAYQFREGH